MSDYFKILIVDDEPIGRQLLEAVLTTEGYDLIFAENGREAVDIALIEKPDLIMLDVMMPELDGFEACREIRKSEDMVVTPVFLITALDDRDSRLRGLDAGADDYISKPFDRIEILAKVKNVRMNRRPVMSENSITPKADTVEFTDSGIEKILFQLFDTDSLIDDVFSNSMFLNSESRDITQGRLIALKLQEKDCIAFFGSGAEKPTHVQNVGMASLILKALNKGVVSMSDLANRSIQLCDGLWDVKAPNQNWISIVGGDIQGNVSLSGVASVVFVQQSISGGFQPYYLTGNQDIMLNKVRQVLLLTPQVIYKAGVPGVMQLLAENPVISSEKEIQTLIEKGLNEKSKPNQTHVAALLRFY